MSDLETVERIAALETQYVKDQMLIDRLNRRNAELLDALKDAKSEIEWAAGCTFDSPIASKLKAAASKMVKAIENAEKTKQ